MGESVRVLRGSEMSKYTEIASSIKQTLKDKANAEKKIKELINYNIESKKEVDILTDVQRVFSTISDDNLSKTLDYVTDIINKALGEIFKGDTRKVTLNKELYAGKHSHINLELVTGDGYKRDISLQAGTGLRQTVSFLYTLAMIEIQGGRKLLVMDELLSGVHPKAKEVLLDLMKIFSEEGFQFIMVEYGVNDFGKMYLVEHTPQESIVSELNKPYNDEIYLEEVE